MLKKFILSAALIAGIGAYYLTALTGESAAASASAIVASGTFEGRSDHITTGGISILKTESGYVAVLEQNFSLDGAPAPTLGFAKGGVFDKATEFAKLAEKEGLQVYAIPANIDPANYDGFVVWCADFAVPLGIAALK